MLKFIIQHYIFRFRRICDVNNKMCKGGTASQLLKKEKFDRKIIVTHYDRKCVVCLVGRLLLLLRGLIDPTDHANLIDQLLNLEAFLSN